MEKTEIQDLIDALNDLSNGILESSTEERTLIEIHGYVAPPLNKSNLAFRPKQMAENLLKLEDLKFDSFQSEHFKEAISHINQFKSISLSSLYHNPSVVIQNYSALLDWIDTIIQPLFSWENNQYNTKLVPVELRKRLVNLQAAIDNLEKDYPQIEHKIKELDNSFYRIRPLNMRLNQLDEAQNNLKQYQESSKKNALEIQVFLQEFEKNQNTIKQQNIFIDEIIKKCNDALSMSTSSSLASAFEQQKKDLQKSIWFWTGILFSTLFGGAHIGSHRIDVITKLLSNNKNENLELLIFNIIFLVFSIGGSLWLSWLATSQITQKFRLSEDYAFKASISKSYEGYRKQAEILDNKLDDTKFITKLFEFILIRLNEHPLNQIEKKTYASPISQIGSELFKKQELTPENNINVSN